MKKLYFFAKSGPDYLEDQITWSRPTVDQITWARPKVDQITWTDVFVFFLLFRSPRSWAASLQDQITWSRHKVDQITWARPNRGQITWSLHFFLAALRPARTFVCSHRAAGDAALAGSAAPTGEPLELARARASGPSGGTVLCRAARVDGARRWWASCVRGAALGFCVVVC